MKEIQVTFLLLRSTVRLTFSGRLNQLLSQPLDRLGGSSWTMDRTIKWAGPQTTLHSMSKDCESFIGMTATSTKPIGE